MGFPTWTLWGMGLAALGALLAIALSFLAQSPRMLTRLRLNDNRLDLRARTLTGYGLALLLLAIGFFAAGVPLGGQDTAVVEPTAEAAIAESTPATAVAETAPTTGSQSGAMVGLPTSEANGVGGGRPTADLTAVAPITSTVETLPTATATTAPGTPTAEATNTPVPTATSTPTPSPTPSPTPILVPTAVVGDDTSTLPVRQLPGGPVLVVLVRGDVVLPLPGHAFQGGDVWREISTVSGIIGWVPDEFLDYGGDE